MDIPKKLIFVAIGAGVALFHAGSVAGYFYAKKKLTDEFNKQLEEELDRTEQFFKKKYKTEEFATPEAAAQALKVDTAATVEVNRTPEERSYEEATEALRVYSGDEGVVDDEPTQIEITRHNVFEPRRHMPSDTPIADELEERSPDAPYIIPRDQFGDPPYETTTLTWYQGDQTMADDRETEVDNVEMMIGSHNLRFGHLSEDPNVVFVRNERYKVDMEILFSEGKFGEVVAGFTG